MIKVTIAGKLGKDAETKSVGQTTVTEFSVASDEKSKSGDKVTTWLRCQIWGTRGEKLCTYLTKGASVTVCGTLSPRAYQKDGQTRMSMDVRVDDIALQGGKREASAEDRSGGGYDRPSGNGGARQSGGSDDFGGGEFGGDEIPFMRASKGIAQ